MNRSTYAKLSSGYPKFKIFLIDKRGKRISGEYYSPRELGMEIVPTSYLFSKTRKYRKQRRKK